MENIVNAENFFLMGVKKGTPEYEVRKAQTHVMANLMAQENLLIQNIENFGLDKPMEELFANLDPFGVEYTANHLLPIFVRAEMLAKISDRQLNWIEEKYEVGDMSAHTQMNFACLRETIRKFSVTYLNGYYRKVHLALLREYNR